MMNTPQQTPFLHLLEKKAGLAASFLGVAILDTARLAAR
jgi:hypothetical protein